MSRTLLLLRFSDAASIAFHVILISSSIFCFLPDLLLIGMKGFFFTDCAVLMGLSDEVLVVLPLEAEASTLLKLAVSGSITN